MGPGLKTLGILGPKNSTGFAQVLGYHPQKFLLKYIKIFLFLKSHHFWKLFSPVIPVHYTIS